MVEPGATLGSHVVKVLKSAALAALVAAAALAPAASAQEQPLESYYAKLSRWDHFNSSGERLTTAAQIIRQDRANYHRFGRRDPGDEGDSFFRHAANRARLEALIAAGQSDPETIDRIVNGTPMIRVDIFEDYVNVYVE